MMNFIWNLFEPRAPVEGDAAPLSQVRVVALAIDIVCMHSVGAKLRLSSRHSVVLSAACVRCLPCTPWCARVAFGCRSLLPSCIALPCACVCHAVSACDVAAELDVLCMHKGVRAVLFFKKFRLRGNSIASWLLCCERYVLVYLQMCVSCSKCLRRCCVAVCVVHAQSLVMGTGGLCCFSKISIARIARQLDCVLVASL